MRDQDRIFDGLAERFARTIYDSVKGEVRLAVIWRDLQEVIPALENAPGPVLDIGGGVGQTGCRLAGLGYRVTLVEPSAEMLDLARAHWRKSGQPLTQSQIVQARWQDLPGLALEPAPLVLFHAVMEWLAEPLAALRAVADQVAKGGILSVLFYNANAVVHTHLLRGNFDVVRSGMLGSRGRTLTPLRPLYPQAVIDAILAAGLEVLVYSGARTFTDHADPRATENIEALIEMELAMSRKPPFRDLARYIHLVCRKS
jgi:S-adenosylmethionine-dependent methyltransferase